MNCHFFFLPHYKDEFLSESEKSEAIVTRIVLPLKEQLDQTKIETKFNEIGIHQILLLGALRKIQLNSGGRIFLYEINENEHTRIVTIQKNQIFYEFKHFKPTYKISIPPSIINSLEDKEKEIYEKDPYVDISLVFDLDDKKRLSPNANCKLYLFYPTDITSGFSFIIHSYFLVTPDRRGLRDSILNKYILEKIAEYISGEWLSNIKKQNKYTFLDLLVFKRNSESSILNTLYNHFVEKLRKNKFLFDLSSKQFYRIDEVIIANGVDKGLFPENQLNGKRIIYINNTSTRDWLINEFNVLRLSNETIASNIEKECIRQKEKKNFPFFENLYSYLTENPELNLLGKNVLLSSKMQLLNSKDYVFYGFKDKFILPDKLYNKINFIHPSIKIPDQRQGKEYTGLIEYNAELLVARLLKLYDDSTVSKVDILIGLLRLNISGRLISELRQKVMLPTKAKNKWQCPFTNPIYFENENLKLIYSEDKFIDLIELNDTGLDNRELKIKLILFGVWEIPAIYFSEKQVSISKNDERFDYIYRNIRSYSTYNFYLNSDWVLDIPVSINQWFTETIIANWKHYVDMVEDDNYPRVKYGSQSSDWHFVPINQLIYLTSLVKYLKTEKWIKVENKEDVFSVAEITGIDPIDAIQIHSSLFKKYLNALSINYTSNLSFIQLLGIKHLDSRRVQDFAGIFNYIYICYKNIASNDNEFILFYNRVLSKLFDLYSQLIIKTDIYVLSNTIFLGVNELNHKLEWTFAKNIYYIEDKPAYDLLPIEIKTIIQPHYSNRDKNRFGQIGKRIGLDFKRTIHQKLVDVEILEEKKLWNWFPIFFECLAFIEVILETNLDFRINQFKETQLFICQNLEIELFKDDKYVTKLEGISHKIIADNAIKIFINKSVNIDEGTFYSNILHDLLVEILGRDLHRIRLQLNDLLSRKSKQEYLKKYEVSQDRIEELTTKIKGLIVTKKQSFWIDLMNVKKIPSPQSYLLDDTIDFDKLLPLVIENEENIKEIANLVIYDKMFLPNNIQPLQKIFSQLSIDLIEFNKVSSIKIDFREYFHKQFEGIKSCYKNSFEKLLHQHLQNNNISEKSKFQDIMSDYDLIQFTLQSPLLFCQVESVFFEKSCSIYSAIKLVFGDLVKNDKKLTSNISRKKQEFKRNLIEQGNIKYIDDFFDINKNRSLLYFEDTNIELNNRFNAYVYEKQKNEPTNPKPNKENLSIYVNLPGTEIENPTTESLGKFRTESSNRNGSSGYRVDGGKVNANQELIGLVAEKIVFEKIKAAYSTVEWVSKNAAKAEENPEGSDEYNCDITYVDVNNQKHYVEVKGKSDDQKQFFLSYYEYLKALKEKENYHIYLVLFALDNTRRRILNLGNLFLLNEDNEDIFNNSKFTANFSSLDIRFKQPQV